MDVGMVEKLCEVIIVYIENLRKSCVKKKCHKNIAEEKNHYICTINNAEENKLEHKKE